MNERILKRAKALLAMSQDNSSEKEAMIAARRLHTLLAEHNISLGELKDKPEEATESSFESIDWPWRRRVGAAVAKLYFCEFYYCKTRKNYANYFLVGTETNRTFANMIIDNVYKMIELEAKTQSKLYHGKVVSSFISSFRNGAANRIIVRCQDLIRDSKAGNLQDEQGNTLPVLASLYDQFATQNEDFMEKLGLITKKSSTRNRDAAGYHAGKKAGDKVPLSRSLQSKSAPKQLGIN